MRINKTHIISLLVILAACFAIYANSFRNEFVWDDEYLVENNAYIKDWRYSGKIFCADVFDGGGSESNFYRPLQSLTYLIDYSFWRLKPLGYHITNTLIHAANAALIYWLAILLLGSLTTALFAALLFLAHPIQTQAVTYISGRAEPLMALFSLLAVILFISRRGARGRYAGSLACFILALLSKETAMILPALLVAYCLIFYEKGEGRRKAFLASIPFFAIDAVYALTRLSILNFSQKSILASPIPLLTRIVISVKALSSYIGLTIFPSGLHMERDMQTKGSLSEPGAWASLIILMTFLVLILKLRRRLKLISFGLAWFLLALVPTSNIFSLNAFIAEHWLYLPSVGIFLATAGAMARIQNANGRRIAVLLFMAILIGAAFLTIRQNSYWREPISFYKRTLRYSPDSARVHYNIGTLYGKRGLTDDAIRELKEAIRADPDYVEAYVNLGYTYSKKGQLSDAEESLVKAISIAPDRYLGYYYMANLYNDTNRPKEAIDYYKKAVGLKRNNADIYFDLARAFDKIGNAEKAAGAYRKAIELDPTNIDAYLNLGAVYAQSGNYTEARSVWEKGLKIDPAEPSIKRNLEKLNRIKKR